MTNTLTPQELITAFINGKVSINYMIYEPVKPPGVYAVTINYTGIDAETQQEQQIVVHYPRVYAPNILAAIHQSAYLADGVKYTVSFIDNNE